MSLVDASQIAMLRGVKNCGKHHEENKLSPAVQFAQECDLCAGKIFAVIWNTAFEGVLQEAIRVIRQ
jgi:hypothetical protein